MSAVHGEHQTSRCQQKLHKNAPFVKLVGQLFGCDLMAPLDKLCKGVVNVISFFNATSILVYSRISFFTSQSERV